MRLDRKALDRLLSLNDEQLKQVVEKLVADTGLDLGKLNISTNDIARLRAVLSGATDSQIQQFAEQYRAVKHGGDDKPEN